MIYGGWPAFREFGLRLPHARACGTSTRISTAPGSPIAGTLTTALIALVIGVPISLGIAIFLTQLCPPWLQAAGRRPPSSCSPRCRASSTACGASSSSRRSSPELRADPAVDSIVEGMPIVGTILYARVPSGAGIADGRHHPRDHDHSLHRLDHARHSRPDPDGAARERLRHRLHHLGGRAPRAPAAGGRQHHRRRHARARPRARRDDGGDLRGRQRQPPLRARSSTRARPSPRASPTNSTRRSACS